MSSSAEPFVSANPAAIPAGGDLGAPLRQEPPTSEPPATTETPHVGDVLTPREQEMLRREGQLVAQEQELKRLRELEEGLRRDPIAVANKHGASMEAWLERFGSSPAPGQTPPQNIPPDILDRLKKVDELEAFRQEQERAAQARIQQEQQTQVREATLAQINKTIDSDDSFKWLKIAGLQGEVYNLIENHAFRTQQQYGVPALLDTAVAAKQIRDAYLPKLQKMLEGLAGVADFEPLFAKIATSRTTPQPQVSGASGPTSITASVSSGTPGTAHGLSREELQAQKRAKWTALLQANQNAQ